MKYTYPVIFQDDTNNNSSHVCFPDFPYECDISYSDYSDLMQKTALELGFALYLREEAKQKFPRPNSINNRILPPSSTMNFVECDYGKFKQSLSVKNINL